MVKKHPDINKKPHGITKESMNKLIHVMEKNANWKFYKSIMLIKLISEQEEYFKNKFNIEEYDDEKEVIKDGLLLEFTRTLWELSEMIAAYCISISKGDPSLIIATTDYRTTDIHEFFKNVNNITEEEILQIMNLNQNVKIPHDKEDLINQNVELIKKSLKKISMFYKNFNEIMCKYKHGSPMLIGAIKYETPWMMESTESDLYSRQIGAIISGKNLKVEIHEININYLGEISSILFLLIDIIFRNRDKAVTNSNKHTVFLFDKKENIKTELMKND